MACFFVCFLAFIVVIAGKATYILFMAFTPVPLGFTGPVYLAVCTAIPKISDRHNDSPLTESILYSKKVVKERSFLYNNRDLCLV